MRSRNVEDGAIDDAKIPTLDASKLTGTIDDARIPASIARDSEVPGDSDIDARVATWARTNSPTGTIPDTLIPATIARDSELPVEQDITRTAFDALAQAVQDKGTTYYIDEGN